MDQDDASEKKEFGIAESNILLIHQNVNENDNLLHLFDYPLNFNTSPPVQDLLNHFTNLFPNYSTLVDLIIQFITSKNCNWDVMLPLLKVIPIQHSSSILTHFTSNCVKNQYHQPLIICILLARHLLQDRRSQEAFRNYEIWIREYVLYCFFPLKHISKKELKRDAEFVGKVLVDMISQDRSSQHIKTQQSILEHAFYKNNLVDWYRLAKKKLTQMGQNLDGLSKSMTSFSVHNTSLSRDYENQVENILVEYSKNGKIPIKVMNAQFLQKTWLCDHILPTLLLFDKKEFQ
ncbi:hypothetical protein AKO1_007137, partial [Acrasis kona]